MSDDILEPDSAVAEEFRELLTDPAARLAFTELRHQAAQNGARRNYEHVLAAVGSQPWAIQEEILALIVDVLAFRVAGGTFTAEEMEARVSPQRRPPPAAGAQGVAVLPLHGVIMPKASMMADMSGGTSIEAFRGQFRQAMASPDVKGVVIDVDSPGGMAKGVPEMAQEIRNARGSKPIVASASGDAASAAYWLASQADEFVVTKSGMVGSIGVRVAHQDESAKAEAEGVKTTLVSFGKFKNEGNPFEPLSADARAHMQHMVDTLGGMFVSDVAKGRGVSVNTVRSDFGEGRMFLAADALKAGMVDRIASTEQVVAEMIGAARLPAGRASAIDFGAFTTTTTATTETPFPQPAPTPEPEPQTEPEPVPEPVYAAEGDQESPADGPASHDLDIEMLRADPVPDRIL